LKKIVGKAGWLPLPADEKGKGKGRKRRRKDGVMRARRVVFRSQVVGKLRGSSLSVFERNEVAASLHVTWSQIVKVSYLIMQPILPYQVPA
jgi:hypothetical protein